MHPDKEVDRVASAMLRLMVTLILSMLAICVLAEFFTAINLTRLFF